MTCFHPWPGCNCPPEEKTLEAPQYGPGNPPPEFDPPEPVKSFWYGTAADMPAIHSQEEFLTALDVLLDHTLHADECYIDAAQTECVCVIGKVRAALPPCGAVRGVSPLYRCTRNAHPASPDRHVFG